MPVSAKHAREIQLATSLGRAKAHWDDFLARVCAAHPGTTAEWKRYSTGWQLVVKDRRRNLLYLNPGQDRFTASLAFSDEALEAARRSDLPDAIVKPISESRKFPEGRAVRLDVASGRDVGYATTLPAIQIAH